jgi:hypothetical protein
MILKFGKNKNISFGGPGGAGSGSLFYQCTVVETELSYCRENFESALFLHLRIRDV